MPPSAPAGGLRMIATDIDGTMLRSDGTLAPRVKEALTAAAERGIHVVPATGRPLLISHDVIGWLGHDEYWVFANGAVTRHLGRDELVRGFWMDHEVTRDLLSLLRQRLPAAGFAVELDEGVAFEAGFEKVVPMVPEGDPVDDILVALDHSAARWQRVQKILVYDHSLEVEELYARVSAVVGKRAAPSYSGLAFIELAAGLVTKATALELLARDLGIDRSQVAAFGDNHNDLDMLRWAGRGYAMGNATDDAKAAADEVIGINDEDGLAVAIEHLIDATG